MNLPPAFRVPLVRARRTIFEALGSARYSRLALNDLDRKIERYLDFDGGYFVEAGANDGITQSNTYYFERRRGWSGILIEPIPELANKCRRQRRRSVVVQTALVAPDFPETEIEMRYAGLMSVADGAFGDAALRQRHIEVGLQQSGVTGTYVVRVPAQTLSAVIAAHSAGHEIDLLSLDVEGAELTALAGLDIARHAPRFICVEAREPAAVAALLGLRYASAEVLADNGTYQDLLFARK